MQAVNRLIEKEREWMNDRREREDKERESEREERKRGREYTGEGEAEISGGGRGVVELTGDEEGRENEEQESAE